MTKERKPIKRSTDLAPLSREHHEGLLFVWKIRQGIRKGMQVDRMVPFCHWFWQHHLVAHFKKEEAALPLLLSEEHPLVQQMIHEHQQIEQLITAVQMKTDDNKLEQLAQTIYDHIRFEERQLFTEAEKQATPEQLQKVAELLQPGKSHAVWEDKFWMQ